MIKTHEEVVSAALALPPEVRAELAERLLSSLDSAEQATVDAAWADVVEKRIDQIDGGEVRLIPGDELIAKLRDRCK